MVITLTWNDTKYEADLSEPHPIAITLHNELEDQPNAFGAPPYHAVPLKDGDFVGAIAHGSPVNFFNVKINPHGNGTHTECVGHILDGDYNIQDALVNPYAIAEVISVYPTQDEKGNKVITVETLSAMCRETTEALVIRTLPNTAEKKSRKYTGTNPPYCSEGAMQWIHERGVKHLLIDLPSVDPEDDGGALKAHKMFWQTLTSPRVDRTITEMVFVDNSVTDGLYLLNIQIAPLELDVSPSRPMLYKLKPTE